MSDEGSRVRGCCLHHLGLAQLDYCGASATHAVTASGGDLKTKVKGFIEMSASLEEKVASFIDIGPT